MLDATTPNAPPPEHSLGLATAELAAIWAENAPRFAQILLDAAELTLDAMRIASFRASEVASAEPPQAAAQAANDALAAINAGARSLRQIAMLAQRLAAPPPTPRPAGTLDPASRRVRRSQVIRGVEDAINNGDSAPEAKARLRAELYERLEHPDFDEDLEHRPVGDVVAEIIRDLGRLPLSSFSPRPRRTPADIEALNARARAAPPPLPPLPPGLERRAHQGRGEGPTPTVRPPGSEPRPPPSPD